MNTVRHFALKSLPRTFFSPVNFPGEARRSCYIKQHFLKCMQHYMTKKNCWGNVLLRHDANFQLTYKEKAELETLSQLYFKHHARSKQHSFIWTWNVVLSDVSLVLGWCPQTTLDSRFCPQITFIINQQCYKLNSSYLFVPYFTNDESKLIILFKHDQFKIIYQLKLINIIN